jgi:multicomponent Na+:H+ antiporter subunit C
MNASMLYLATGFLLFLLGLHSLMVLRDNLRRVIAVNLMGTGVFLLLVTLATRSNPIDPVLQALVVTGLVVAISATALALRLASSIRRTDEEAQAGDDG